MYFIPRKPCEGRKELAHTMVRLQLILFSKRTGAFLFRIFRRFLHEPTTSTQNYCLTGAIISETRTTNIYLNTMHDHLQRREIIYCKVNNLSTISSLSFSKKELSDYLICRPVWERKPSIWREISFIVKEYL
jgi:hypothetical protein